MASEKQFTDWIKEHEKKDRADFSSIHDHLDRLDRVTNNDLIVYKIDELKSQFTDFEKSLKSTYVTKTEFLPIQKLVYGMVGLILVSVVGAVLALVVKK